MKTMKVRYSVEYQEFTKACIYGVVMRHRKGMRLAAMMMIAALVYSIGAAYGAWSHLPVLYYVAGAYSVWLMILLAGALRGARDYLKTKDCLMGQELLMTLHEDRLQVKFSKQAIQENATYASLYCVVELSRFFLIYISSQQTYILPYRALADGERKELHNRFASVIPDRFNSRYDQDGELGKKHK